MNGEWPNGIYKDLEFLDAFEYCARKVMIRWNSKRFQKDFSTLYKVIQLTGATYKKLLSDKYEAEKLKNKKDAEIAKETPPQPSPKGREKEKKFARRPKVKMGTDDNRFNNYIFHWTTQVIDRELLMESGQLIPIKQINRPKYTFKPHQNIKRHRCTK